MKLLHIATEKCPDCPSRVTLETQHNQHTNGHWNETRKFACGFEVAYSPNSLRESTTAECKKGPKFTLVESKRKEAGDKLIALLKDLDVDDNFKAPLYREIEYRSRRGWY